MAGTIAENIEGIKQKIALIQPNAQLVAVSKNHDIGKIKEAIKAGQELFGENRVQEAAAKFPHLKKEYPNIELHMIGPLQSNKAKDALKLFDVIQTIDREKLAGEVAKNITSQSATKEFFIQVNIGEEEQKAGIFPQHAEEFYKFCANDLELNITGLMCIPPLDEPAFMYFALLRNIASKIKQGLKLSMGMSSDYEEALELGADYIRIGTAIFGER